MPACDSCRCLRDDEMTQVRDGVSLLMSDLMRIRSTILNGFPFVLSFPASLSDPVLRREQTCSSPPRATCPINQNHVAPASRESYPGSLDQSGDMCNSVVGNASLCSIIPWERQSLLIMGRGESHSCMIRGREGGREGGSHYAAYNQSKSSDRCGESEQLRREAVGCLLDCWGLH